MNDAEQTPHFLTGQILIAMPGIQDPRFHHTLIYVCSHTEAGAMGLIINKPAAELCWADVFGRLDIPLDKSLASTPVHFGGPVEAGRGFVLHSSDYHAKDATLHVDEDISMTATLDILQALGQGHGPRHALVMLGYAGWGPGQLETEIRVNGWLCCNADQNLLFEQKTETKWTQALDKLGINPAMLAPGGHA